jgi:hypothetical protein
MFYIRSTTAITGTVNWVAATRNDGEAHWASDAEQGDAWMVVHVVGTPNEFRETHRYVEVTATRCHSSGQPLNW